MRRRGRQGKLGLRFTQVVDPLPRRRQFVGDRLALFDHRVELRGDLLVVRHRLRLVAAGARQLLVRVFASLAELGPRGAFGFELRLRGGERFPSLGERFLQEGGLFVRFVALGRFAAERGAQFFGARGRLPQFGDGRALGLELRLQLRVSAFAIGRGLALAGQIRDGGVARRARRSDPRRPLRARRARPQVHVRRSSTAPPRSPRIASVRRRTHARPRAAIASRRSTGAPFPTVVARRRPRVEDRRRSTAA